jgi:indole-3-glycerol phosphate synthase
MHMNILNEILKHKREELEAVKSDIPLSELKARIADMDTVKSFKAAIKREPGSRIKLIAELKKASPSKGLIRNDFNISEIVSIYDKKNAAAISVLTESRFFSGSLDYLTEARKRTLKPLLRKDFIFDDYQVYEARASSADAILLIAAALEKSQLSDLYGLAKELTLDCLVEAHNFKELDTALNCGAEIIGINNRDLVTLDINIGTTFDFVKDIPDDRVVVSESGINTREDVEALESTKTDAVLVGTAIMRAGDIGSKIDELMGR